jgi:hypothetical protein
MAVVTSEWPALRSGRVGIVGALLAGDGLDIIASAALLEFDPF